MAIPVTSSGQALRSLRPRLQIFITSPEAKGTLGAALARGLPFIGFMLVARLAPVQEIARVAMIVAFSSGVGAVAASPAIISGSRDVASAVSSSNVRSSYLYSSKRSFAVASTFAVAIVAFPSIRVEYFALTSESPAEAALLLSALGISWASTVANYYLAGAGNYGHAAIVRIVRGVLLAAGMMLIALGGSIEFLYLSIVFGEVTAWVYGARMLPASGAGGGRVSWGIRSWSTMLAAALLQTANLALLAVLAGASNGAEEVSEYAVSQRWVVAILFVPSALAPTFISLLSRDGSVEGRENQLRRLLWIYGLCSIAPAAVVFAMAGPITNTLTPGLPGAIWPLRIAALAAISVVLNQVVSNLAVAQDKWKRWVASDVLLALGLAMTMPLIVVYGAAGALAGVAGAYLFSAGFLFRELAFEQSVLDVGEGRAL